MNLFICSGTILIFVILLFFLYFVMYMESAYVAVFGVIVIFFIGSYDEFEYVFEKVEWDFLLFFVGLFVFIEGIVKFGLFRVIVDEFSTFIVFFFIG